MVRRPPASSGFCGVWEAPAAPTTVVRRVAGLPPTLAMPMEALWFGSSGQIQRAEYGAAVAGVAGGLAFGRALVTTPRPVVARTRIATRPRVVRARPVGTSNFGRLGSCRPVCGERERRTPWSTRDRASRSAVAAAAAAVSWPDPLEGTRCPGSARARHGVERAGRAAGTVGPWPAARDAPELAGGPAWTAGPAVRNAVERSGRAAGTAGAAGTTGTTGARAARGARVTRPRRGRAWPGRLGSDLTGRGWAGAGRCRGGRAGGVLSAGEGPWAAPLLLMACGATGDRCLALLLRARGAAAARLLGPGGRRGRRLWPIDLRPRRRRWRRLPSGPLRRRWRRPRGRLEGVGPVRRPAIWIRRSAGGIARRGVRVARPLERIVELERVVGDPEGVEVWPERVAQGPLRPEGVILLVERVERDVVVVVAGHRQHQRRRARAGGFGGRRGPIGALRERRARALHLGDGPRWQLGPAGAAEQRVDPLHTHQRRTGDHAAHLGRRLALDDPRARLRHGALEQAGLVGRPRAQLLLPGHEVHQALGLRPWPYGHVADAEELQHRAGLVGSRLHDVGHHRLERSARPVVAEPP